MNTTDSATVNSQTWWEDYFATQWDNNNGRAQTAYFMRQLVESLPVPIQTFLASDEPTVLDWGCAFGNGVDVLAKSFPNCHVTGIDFAERAIIEARRSFPSHDFRHTKNGAIGDQFDVIVTSNCLEHFADPLSVMRQHFEFCRRFYITMVPYREWPLLDQHLTHFHDGSFPERIDGFTRLSVTVADSKPEFWRGQQILVVYESQTCRSMRVLRKVTSRLLPYGSRRRHIAGLGLHALRGEPRPALSAVQCQINAVTARIAPVLWSMRCRIKKVAARLAPAGTVRGRWARAGVQKLREIRYPATHQSTLTLAEILRDTADRKGIVIYPPFIDWGWMRQRPHQLMAEFAKAGYLSLFCSPKCRGDSFSGFMQVADRLYLCDSLDPLHDLPAPLLVVGWTGHLETTKAFRSPVIVYDYLDDLSVSSEGGKPDQHKLAQHRKLVAKSDVVLATARRLYDEVHAIRPDALYCPNGVDYDHFHQTDTLPVPADIADLVARGRPIIGYYGALARWFDYDLVAHAASARKDCEFLLIGPDFDGTLAASNLGRLPNVRWVGEKKYDELPAYLQQFTVATIPFLVNAITMSTSPVKLFEYMAGTKPIVTTDMPECRQYASVRVAHDAAEYVAAIDQAILDGKQESYRQLLDEEARSNTWESRVRQIIAHLDAMNTQKQLRSA